MPIFPTTIIGNQAREPLQAENEEFVTTPFGEPGHNTNILFAQDGYFVDILDTEFGPGAGGGSGRGMNELGRLFFKPAYDEDTPIVGIISFRYGLMDICPGGAGGPYHFAY
jgi:hypothetical protein